MLQNAEHFFATARERYGIKLRREAGVPYPWTTDKEFLQWRFCNVHREDDKVTRWFRDNIRSQLNGFGVVRATVIFRWFNRIETGEIIKPMLLSGTWDRDRAYQMLENEHPVVTGAYIINGMPGYTKLGGVLYNIERALPMLDSFYVQWKHEHPLTLQRAWDDLRKIPYHGGFMAYEVVSDLRWTDVLSNAPDILTWANAGPGCARGLGRVIDGNSEQFNRGSDEHQRAMVEHMRELLAMSRQEQHWPQAWPAWEMREVEHWLCEYDKYVRSQAGDRMKRSYKVV